MSDRWAAASCDDAIWSGYGGYPDQPRALRLVVCYARHPALRFREAYDLPCRRFYDRYGRSLAVIRLAGLEQRLGPLFHGAETTTPPA
jgi:hypothetical protein